MYKLYKEKELTFSILMIVAYCVLNILATQLNNMVGTDTVFFQMIFTILLVIILFAFIFKNGLKEKYGLNKIKISYKEALFFIPIVIIATRNIWFGFSWNMSLSTTVIYVIRMAFVGICEELLFRGFLYKAIEKDNKVEAIVISSLTFAVGHILNLLNGEDLANSIFTVVGAISYGFMFVVLFVCTKSLIPSIIMHSAIDMLSAFANMEMNVFNVRIICIIICTVIIAGYSWYLLKMYQKKNRIIV